MIQKLEVKALWLFIAKTKHTRYYRLLLLSEHDAKLAQQVKKDRLAEADALDKLVEACILSLAGLRLQRKYAFDFLRFPPHKV